MPKRHLKHSRGLAASILLFGFGIAVVEPACSWLSSPTCSDEHICGDTAGSDASVPPGDSGLIAIDAADSAPNYACCDGAVSEDGGNSDAATDAGGPDGGPTCGPGTSSCDGGQGCIDLNSSIENCGACGHTCTAPPNGTPTCTGGTCGITCESSLELCSGACVDPTSTSSCGGCNACPAPDGGYATCSSGTCGVACNAPLTDCSGVCLDTRSSVQHCGATCQPCTTTVANAAPSCSSGTCGFTCDAPNYFLCNGTCHSNTAGPTDSCYVTESFGVFVSPNGSDSSGKGTRAAPYATIGYAVQHAAGLPNVFTCQGTYTGQVNLGSSTPAITIYGGFSCPSATAWTYTASAPSMVTVATAAGTIPLVINGVTAAVTIANMTFKAANASGQDANGNGLSSIAAFANASPNITMNTVALQAGNATGGVSNASPSANYAGGTAPSGEGPSDPDAGTYPSGGSVQCLNGNTSGGGVGGPSSPTIGGGAGVWSPPGTTTTGYDGRAGGANCSPTADPGASGAGGSAGTGASDWGTLNVSAANPWTPLAGAKGGYGNPGEGGGGGGSLGGVAGSGGGSGGCGGTGGPAGGGGGSSFGLLASNSPVTLTGCTIKTGNGGGGGQGGSGEAGQAGGAPGQAGLGGCSGQYGGNGGGGGGGGGGAGGLSVGIAYVGTFSSTPASFAAGSAGTAGSGGAGGNPGTNFTSTLNPGSAGSSGSPSTKPGVAAAVQALE